MLKMACALLLFFFALNTAQYEYRTHLYRLQNGRIAFMLTGLGFYFILYLAALTLNAKKN